MLEFDTEDDFIDADDLDPEDDLQDELDEWFDDDCDPEDEQENIDDEEDDDEEIEDFFDEEDDFDDDTILGPHQGKDEDDSDDDPILGPHQGKDEDDSDDDPILGPHQGKDEDDSDDDPILGPHQGKDADDSDDNPILGPHQGKDADDSDDDPILGPHQGKDEDDSDDDLDIDLDEWLDGFDDEDELEAFDEPILGPHQGNRGGASNYENFESDGLETVVGDISEDMDNWHEQEGNTCAVCAQEFVLEALTGREFDMDELRELAEDNGWFDDGTPLWDVGNLLEHYGLQVEKFTGGTCEDIQDCLNAGGKVIVSVDSDEVWFGKNDELFFPGSDSDHAVQVIGFDYSNPNEPMVILNDSGVANGCGAMISLENFQDAWEDGDCFMVTAYA